MRNKNQAQKGFTLIEILVVVAIIALLTSIALISLMSARQKSRDVKRLSDMTQMNTALEVFFAHNKGYPASISGVPENMTPTFLTTIPKAPTPADGYCEALTNPLNYPANSYYYIHTGTSFVNGEGDTVWSDYIYYFCLGQKTGNFDPGVRILNPKGVR